MNDQGDRALPQADRAVVNGAASVSAVPASVPSAEDIRKVADLFDPKAFEPIIERATQDIYERILNSCQDYLRDNTNWNIGSHIDMLERENQRMRTEIYEADRALGCISLGPDTRIQAIKETQARHAQATNELWALRAERAQGIELLRTMQSAMADVLGYLAANAPTSAIEYAVTQRLVPFLAQGIETQRAATIGAVGEADESPVGTEGTDAPVTHSNHSSDGQSK